MLPPETLESLRHCELFTNLGEAETICFADAVEAHYPKGSFLIREGQPVQSFRVLVSGDIRVFKRYGDQEVVLASQSAGGFFGEIPILLGLDAPADALALTDVHAVEFDRAAFFKMLRTCEPAATRILRALASRIRGVEGFNAQREKLASLGTLAAGMAHELNNPIAAARRAISSLGETMQRWRELSLEISLDSAAVGCWPTLQELERDAVAAARAPRGELDPIARSDAEDALMDWMDARGVEESWKLAPTFVGSGLGVEWMEANASRLPADAVCCILPWLEAGLAVDAILREADEATGRVADLVKSIKSYSHMDRQPRQRADLHEGIETTLKILAHKLRGVEVVRAFDPRIPQIVGYPGELNQVWTNLAANAAEAMLARGQTDARLTIRTELEDEGHVCVTIEDNGPGIPPELQSRIFDPFFTTKPVGEGTGLGLVICHRIVADRHGGEIELTSEPGRTCFHVRLPLIAPAERRAQEGEARAMA
ncbi:MAG: cyclic nucleotide-binding domain-containing protein [Verrucomicrobia bacterium]|nr:cyclic nucleotide-binding domain-containing protein [Verrucomicrobiota bacterium]